MTLTMLFAVASGAPVSPLHDRDKLSAAGDFVGPAPRQKLLPDVRELSPLHVLERKLIADAESLAVDEVDVVTGFVADGEIGAQRKQLLLQDVSHSNCVR